MNIHSINRLNTETFKHKPLDSKHKSTLLPTRREEREVLGVESILVAILASSQDMKTIALQLH